MGFLAETSFRGQEAKVHSEGGVFHSFQPNQNYLQIMPRLKNPRYRLAVYNVSRQSSLYVLSFSSSSNLRKSCFLLQEK
jgi:hypothetical protein